MDFIQNAFSGIGTEILCSLVSFLLGGVTGYKIGTSSRNKQSQKAGDNSTQIQIGNTNNIDGHK